ncbi:anaphase-promoting complex subunit 11 [Colletotrichum truncatum]|uniref:Anaphase-promoting complex subunit 11 n=1 Tax=Colletotrichum truncatum TaxID=5467 RepID=A0ACC3YST2_COLTU
MPPSSSSNFRPFLDPIVESNSSQHLDPGKDANQCDALNPVTHPSRRPRNKTSSNRAPVKRYPTSRDRDRDCQRLMMADVPTSPRPEIADHHPAGAAGAATSPSSSQNQKAPATTSDNRASPDITTADASAEADHQLDDAEPEPEPEPEPVAPKLDPAGFFTLVSNSTTNTTHHPTVKYIFLDDDPDILTSALATQHAANQVPAPSASTSKTGRSQPNPADRTILLDMVPGPDGQWAISSAASLSADFAVTEASISRQEGEKEGGMVLKIDGVESEGIGAGGDKDKTDSLPSSNSGVAKSGGEDYGPLLEDFERKMSVLRRVVKAGEGRAEKAREKKTEDGVEGEGTVDGQE